MSAQEEAGSGPERVAIGIAFGNSNSSIAFTTSEGKAEVIANEDGGERVFDSMFLNLTNSR
jgi:molecular chaperone DnaK (HSP70)